MIAGRYALDREVGRGGMGAVWLGQDEVLGRAVALKRIGLLPGADRTDLSRAEREAKLSARLHHPHVVSVFDAVIDEESDAWWLVMEYVDGVDLARLVRDRGALSPDDAASLIGQAADGLAAAHKAGIVHRDVKPSNILVDRHGQVKLTDFGIARIVNDATLTQTGFVTGSPAYLAPEVAAGGRADEASDVWSLGATLFHVLAGRAPYDIGDNVLGGLYRIVNEEAPRLPDAGWLAPLLEATMVKEPSQRWSMKQVHAYLTSGTGAAPPVIPEPTQRVAPADPEGTQVISTAGAPRRQRSRRGPLIGLAVLLVLAALVGGAVLLNAGDDPSDGTAGSTPSASPSEKAPKPTEEGMESFIRDYVTATADDPSESWQMLTPKFQAESGGFGKYEAFWENATNGRVLSISANPDDLSVSYQVRFDNFDNGPGPTVLDLTFEDGKYLIDGERTPGV